jgi:hypothetical protein
MDRLMTSVSFMSGLASGVKKTKSVLLNKITMMVLGGLLVALLAYCFTR